jgi:hypothetical protein
MTAVPAPGNRLPGRAREITNRPRLGHPPGARAGSDVVRPSPGGGQIAVISVDRKGGMGAQGFERCDPISLPQLELAIPQSVRFGTLPFTYYGWISSQRLGIERAWYDPAVGMAADDQFPAHAHRIFDVGETPPSRAKAARQRWSRGRPTGRRFWFESTGQGRFGNRCTYFNRAFGALPLCQPLKKMSRSTCP